MFVSECVVHISYYVFVMIFNYNIHLQKCVILITMLQSPQLPRDSSFSMPLSSDGD